MLDESITHTDIFPFPFFPFEINSHPLIYSDKMIDYKSNELSTVEEPLNVGDDDVFTYKEDFASFKFSFSLTFISIWIKE